MINTKTKPVTKAQQVEQLAAAVAAVYEEVNHPAHYTDGGIETIDFIEAKLSPEEFRGYCLGNIIKYLSRTGKKGDLMTDLRKAQWYLARIAKEG